MIVVGTLLASRWIRFGIQRAFAAKGVTDAGRIGITTRLTHYVILLAGLSMALETAGIEISALFAAGAIFAVGLGFAMQTLVENFVSGIILLLERSIKPGDVLLMDGEPVQVMDMYIRTTVVRSLDDVDHILPNSQLASGRVLNLSNRQQAVRVRTQVSVHYGSDMAQVREVLERAAGDFPERSKVKDPVVILTDFGDSGVAWEISIWIPNPWHLRQVRGRLNEAIWDSLKSHAITIPYPQVDLHVKDRGPS